MSIKLSFHGAAKTVTGSCHYLSIGGLNILIDCGIFQGGRKMDDLNYGDFGFEPSSIDYLLLTHGHLDHCGRIPALIRKGFQGKIITTSATYDIAKIIFLDSAKIQEEDYKHWKRISLRKGLKPREPLYTTVDALDTLKHFGTFANYEVPIRLNGKVEVTFRDAGHIFGSAFVEIVVDGARKLVFSGDLGNREKPVIEDPSLPVEGDIVVVESTYATRDHKNIEDTVQELKTAILDTFNKGGNVLIPAFAIERAQELLYFIRQFRDNGELPKCKVFLDSPMAIRVTEVMRKHPECFDDEMEKLLQKNNDPFDFPGLEFTKSAEESKQINFTDQSIIIAGSGMCTGGRIKHHLKHNIWRKESSIIFTGYQAAGTLGRRIVSGRKKVRIFGETYRVRANVYTIGGFSAHAGKRLLTEWLRNNKKIQNLFLVHGEKESLTAFQKHLKKEKMAAKIFIPRLHEKFIL